MFTISFENPSLALIKRIGRKNAALWDIVDRYRATARKQRELEQRGGANVLRRSKPKHGAMIRAGSQSKM